MRSACTVSTADTISMVTGPGATQPVSMRSARGWNNKYVILTTWRLMVHS